jgi:hypothetical protein
MRERKNYLFHESIEKKKQRDTDKGCSCGHGTTECASLRWLVAQAEQAYKCQSESARARGEGEEGRVLREKEGEKRRDTTGYRLASALTGPSGPVGMKEGRLVGT